MTTCTLTAELAIQFDLVPTLTASTVQAAAARPADEDLDVEDVAHADVADWRRRCAGLARPAQDDAEPGRGGPDRARPGPLPVDARIPSPDIRPPAQPPVTGSWDCSGARAPAR
jgi:hypothetical protein